MRARSLEPLGEVAPIAVACEQWTLQRMRAWRENGQTPGYQLLARRDDACEASRRARFDKNDGGRRVRERFDKHALLLGRQFAEQVRRCSDISGSRGFGLPELPATPACFAHRCDQCSAMRRPTAMAASDCSSMVSEVSSGHMSNAAQAVAPVPAP